MAIGSKPPEMLSLFDGDATSGISAASAAAKLMLPTEMYRHVVKKFQKYDWGTAISELRSYNAPPEAVYKVRRAPLASPRASRAPPA